NPSHPLRHRVFRIDWVAGANPPKGGHAPAPESTGDTWFSDQLAIFPPARDLVRHPSVCWGSEYAAPATQSAVRIHAVVKPTSVYADINDYAAPDLCSNH